MIQPSTHVLLLEDNPGDSRLIQELIAQFPDARFTVELTERLSGALQRLRQGGIDVVLSDLALPDAKGLEVIRQLHTQFPTLPIVVLTGPYEDEAAALQALTLGVQDYLVKGRVDNYLLVRAIRYAIERKRIEEELRFANKQLEELSRVKDEFLGTVSHELRTPLAITQEGISQVLDGLAGPLTERQQKTLGMVSSNIVRLGRLINDLLDMSKLEARQVKLLRTRLNVVALAQQVVAMFTPRAQAKGLTLKVCSAQPVVEVYADVDRMAQILTNLVGNAIKFTERGGAIELSVSADGPSVDCVIADTGMGIANEDLPQVFKKFQQFHRPAGGGGEKGTGLGLAITKQLVELHHGTIRVESELGQGTHFIFTLPKYRVELLLKEQLSDALTQASEREESVSLLCVWLADAGTSPLRCAPNQLETVVGRMAGALKESLRRQGDMALQVSEGVAVILTGCAAENAWRVQGRLESVLKECLAAHTLAGSLQCRWSCATYPDDAQDAEGLLVKAFEDGHGGPPVAAEHPVKAAYSLPRG